jgi:MFS family permease
MQPRLQRKGAEMVSTPTRERLPAAVRVLQAGLVVNAFGNGAAAPFLILYLHNVRGIPLPVAGLASATAAGSAVVATLVAGGVADRRGLRPTMLGGLICSTVAYALYPLVGQAWHALVLAALAGTGIGTWLTMQSSTLAAITPPPLRHVAFAWQRVAANVGLGLGGFAGGLIVVTSRPATFTTLFWLNAATFVVYGLVLLRVRTPAAPARGSPGVSYRDVVRDRVFLRLMALNVVFVAAAISLLNALVPVYAVNQARVGERFIGALFLLNSLTIIALQLPVARRVEGRSRMRAFALMGLLFAASLLLIAIAPVVSAGTDGVAAAVLVMAIVVFSVAECLYDAVQGPLVADLAPPERLGRYMAVTGFSWQLGFIVGPAAGAAILAATPTGLWWTAAALCLVGVAFSIRLDRHLPERVRRTPARVK